MFFQVFFYADYEPGWGKNTLRILPNNLHKLDLRGG